MRDGTLVTEDKVLTKRAQNAVSALRAQNAVSALQRLRAICAEHGLHPVIEVGGGENVATAAQAQPAKARLVTRLVDARGAGVTDNLA